VSGENFSVRSAVESGMKFPDALGCFRIARGMALEQVFGLMLEMIEIGIGREALYRHNELPFGRPMSA
jgi:hypothetical protein